MNIIVTKHARERMHQRSIKLSLLKKALKVPLVRKPSYSPTEIIQYIDETGTLEVVFKQEGSIYIIITAYFI